MWRNAAKVCTPAARPTRGRRKKGRVRAVRDRSSPGAACSTMVAMRYRRAVEKLQALAEECESVKGWPPEDPFLLEAWVFGAVLRGADPLDCVEVVVLVNLPP